VRALEGERASAALAQCNPEMGEATRATLATQIARGIKWVDLSTDRHHDYIFDPDHMIAFEGDTGPYLQYAHARVRSIFRRLGTP
jgi:arginyl-tRNA synthetase